MGRGPPGAGGGAQYQRSTGGCAFTACHTRRRHHHRARAAPAGRWRPPGTAAMPSIQPIAAVPAAASMMARRAGTIIANRWRRSDHWRIGWRWNDGPGVGDTLSLAGPRWNVLPDDGDRFYADPFPVEWQGRYACCLRNWPMGKARVMAPAKVFSPPCCSMRTESRSCAHGSGRTAPPLLPVRVFP